MNIRLLSLTLEFKRSVESIDFGRFNYFHGGIGAGKSSIARLVDYCLGGHLVNTPALQSEFSSATLHLELNGKAVQLERPKDSSDVLARWIQDGTQQTISLPTRRAGEQILPGVEVLSDLILQLSGQRIVRVRRGNSDGGGRLERLSFRNLWNYCYLSQDDLDSDFFDLEPEADHGRRSKARDVLRYVLGHHQEEVTQLEVDLDMGRQEKRALEGTVKALHEGLAAVGFTSLADVQRQEAALAEQAAQLRKEIQAARETTYPDGNHAVEHLKTQARKIHAEVAEIESELRDLRHLVDKDIRQRDELLTLQFKFKRSAGARAVLSGVEFTHCPRCTQALPERAVQHCHVCGQTEDVEAPEPHHAVLETDLKQRLEEIGDVIRQQENGLQELAGDRARALQDLKHLDLMISRALAEYDTLYVARVVSIERALADVERQQLELERWRRLPELIEQHRERIMILTSDEIRLRLALKDARRLAERDGRALKDLRALFLDCLVGARIPGLNETDVVKFAAPTYYPEISARDEQQMIITSFSTLSSGGKKTLFKCCFALALHRLAAKYNSPLPRLLIIDTPMKNISTQENREQFEGFHEMLYRLAITELSQTQFIFIDNEFKRPSQTIRLLLDMRERYMTTDREDSPPLIRYYRGK